MQNIGIQITDECGAKTLNIISDANRFNNWIYETIRPFCRGNIIEIGSGLGNISSCFIANNERIMLTDLRKEYCELLKERFERYPCVMGIRRIDLTDKEFESNHYEYLNSFDTLFVINVIEHIYDDKLAISNCGKLLKESGKLIIMVPSYQALFNDFDINLGHFRRYTKKSLSSILTSNSFRIVHRQYFNFFGLISLVNEYPIVIKTKTNSIQINKKKSIIFTILFSIYFSQRFSPTTIVESPIELNRTLSASLKTGTSLL